METRHHFNQTQPLFVAPVQGMAERWLNRKNPRRCWSYSGTRTQHGDCGVDCLACAAGEVRTLRGIAYVAVAEPVVVGQMLSLYTEDDDAPTNPVTAPFPLTKTVYKTIENNGDHRLAQRHSGTWRVLRNP